MRMRLVIPVALAFTRFHLAKFLRQSLVKNRVNAPLNPYTDHSLLFLLGEKSPQNSPDYFYVHFIELFGVLPGLPFGLSPLSPRPDFSICKNVD